MRLSLVVALSASLGVAFADDTVIEERAARCAVQGDRREDSFFSSPQASFLDPAQCGALCRSYRQCESYSIGNGACRLYRQSTSRSMSRSSRGQYTFYDSQCASSTQMCQVRGFRSFRNQAFKTSTKLVDNTFSGCSTLCKNTRGCSTFSILLGNGGSCRLYRNPLVQDFTADRFNTNIYWDITCPASIATTDPTIAPYTPTVTIPTLSTEAAVSFPDPTEATLLTTDSPPYTPTGPIVTPTDDNDFITEYTYFEYPLPTMNATGSPPVTTGIAQPTDLATAPCMVTPGAQAQFTILDNNYFPMVSRSGNSIGPLLQPTAAPAANDPILDPSTFTVPTFYLQEPDGVTGVYDLLYSGTTPPSYVAMQRNGRVVLTSSSTGTSFSRNLVTTIFNIDCYGRITVTQGGNQYNWVTNGGTSTMQRSSNPDNNMKALPENIPEVQAARKDRKRNKELADRLVKRSYSDGPAPKCPATPPNLVARTKEGYQLDQGNFCDNLNDLWGLSPFSFDGSCAVQSLCYDQCEDFGWQSCNAIFGTMMILSCLDVFEHWWEVALAIACEAQAAYFTGVAATSTGRDLFYKAQGAMCACFCSDPPDTCVYNDGSKRFYCTDVHGNDEDNCGNCGAQCGPNSACHSGACGCPQDQCGTTCLDFRSDAKNCGACNNACDPPYCVGGSCYVPQPGQCAPDQSVYNNDFSDYTSTITNWTFAAYPGCSLGDQIKFGPSTYTPQSGDPTSALFVDMSNLADNGCQAAVAQLKVKMCPGFQYELKFDMGYVNEVDDSPVQSNADCTVRWVTGTPDAWNTNDAYQASPDYNIGYNNPDYKTFGPWSLHVSQDDPGVTHFRGDLFITLTAVINCGGASGGAGRFALTHVDMTPVSQLKVRSLDGSEGPASGLVLRQDNSTSNMTAALKPYHLDLGSDPIPVSYKAKAGNSTRLMRRSSQPIHWP